MNKKRVGSCRLFSLSSHNLHDEGVERRHHVDATKGENLRELPAGNELVHESAELAPTDVHHGCLFRCGRTAKQGFPDGFTLVVGDSVGIVCLENSTKEVQVAVHNRHDVSANDAEILHEIHSFVHCVDW